MLHIGWSELNITPDKKVSLHGQFAERISEYVEKPLTATALALEKDGEQAVFVSCDLAGITWNLVCAVRDRLSGNSMGLDPNKVMFNAIHTHTGPNYTMSERAVDDNTATFDKLRQTLTGFLRPGQKYIEKENVSTNPEVASEEEVFDLLVERLSRVTLDAWNNRKEGYVVSAFGRAVVGMCRRAVYSDGSAQMWGNTDTAVFSELEGGSDSGIELLYLLDAEKNLTGVVANLACPAQCVQHRMFVSPDFWGETMLKCDNDTPKNQVETMVCSSRRANV